MFNSNMVIKWISVIILCLIPTLLYGMDDLEKAYKDQLESYNKGIALHEKQQGDQFVRSAKWLELSLGTLDSRARDMADRNYHKAQKTFDELGYKLEDERNKRQELKIKVLEKYGTLPAWWVEH